MLRKREWDEEGKGNGLWKWETTWIAARGREVRFAADVGVLDA